MFPIHWASKTQRLICLSTAESELTALMEGVKITTYYHHLISTLFDLPISQIGGNPMDKDTIEIHHNVWNVYTDNQAALAIAMSDTGLGRTKHMSLRYQYVKEAVSRFICRIFYCESTGNYSDCLTKAGTRERSLKLLAAR